MTVDRRTFVAGLASAPLLVRPALALQAGPRVAAAPISLEDTRVWLPVHFGSEGPFGFIVDSGAVTNLIGSELAARLRMRERGAVSLSGIGGVRRFQVFEAPNVALGPVRVGSIRFGAMDDVARLHPRAGGALSAGLLTVADTDLDFDRGEWRLHLDGRGDRAGFEQLRSTIQSTGPEAGAALIHVEARLDGHDLRLLVDTGAPGGLALSPSATRRTGRWNDRAPFAPHRRNGLGGIGARARLVRAGRLSIGGIAFDRPIVSLTDPGSSEGIRTDGILGIRFIQCMNLSTDVRARRLWAMRNRRPEPADRYPMSGLWVEERDGRLVVAVVGAFSPAAEAGIRPGDVIVGRTLPEFVRSINGSAGDVVPVELRRGEETLNLRLTLRDFL